MWKRKKKEEHEKVDCTGCIHLCYNNDGTTACNSFFEKECLVSDIRMFKEFPPSKEYELHGKIKCFKVVRETYWEESKRFLETHTMNHPLYKLSWEDEREYDKITSIVKTLGDKIKEMENELKSLQAVKWE